MNPEENSAASSDNSLSIDRESLGTEAISEDLALAELEKRDLAPDGIERISVNSALMKSRKVRLAVVGHPRCPRRIALRLLRELYTFDLMQFALKPGSAPDLKRMADEFLIARLVSIPLGGRIAIARRSSPRVAAALLLDKESRVWQTALDNQGLTEAAVVKALQQPNATPAFVEAICRHAKWSIHQEIRLALLRNPHTPLARALEFARRLTTPQLRDALFSSRLPEKIKAQLRKDIEARNA
jgi:hypothetical protein